MKIDEDIASECERRGNVLVEVIQFIDLNESPLIEFKVTYHNDIIIAKNTVQNLELYIDTSEDNANGEIYNINGDPNDPINSFDLTADIDLNIIAKTKDNEIFKIVNNYLCLGPNLVNERF